MPFKRIWDEMRDHFFNSASLLSRVAAMGQVEMQGEIWFQAELVWLLNELEKRGMIKSWERECLTEIRKKVDFKVHLATSTSAAVEVKTALCGRDKHQLLPLRSYGETCARDAVKLAASDAPHRYLLVFAYPSKNHSLPTANDWDELVKVVRAEAAMPAVGPCTGFPFPDSSPGGELSMGVLEIPIRLGPPTQG